MRSLRHFLLLSLIAVPGFATAAADEKLKKTYADRGTVEIGGRIDFSYSSVERGGNLGRQSDGTLYVAPQLGYFFVKGFEVSVFPTMLTRFYYNKETETTYGALIAPAYVLPYLRPWFPYIEGLAGSLLSKNTVSLTVGVGAGVKILILENALLKIGITYLRNDKRSRLDSNIFELEDSVSLSLGFGIFF
jgi:hypothetical protein